MTALSLTLLTVGERSHCEQNQSAVTVSGGACPAERAQSSLPTAAPSHVTVGRLQHDGKSCATGGGRRHRFHGFELPGTKQVVGLIRQPAAHHHPVRVRQQLSQLLRAAARCLRR